MYRLLINLLVSLPLIAGEAKFGPEIEFRGLGQQPGLVCKSAPAVVPVLLAGSAVVGVIEDGKKQTGLAGMGATGLMVVGCVTVNNLAISETYLKKLHRHLLPREKNGELTLTWGYDENLPVKKFLTVEYKNGKKIVFGLDPTVVEVKMPGLTAEQMASDSGFYQKEIYENARAVGLKIPRTDGPWNGGHIHIDIASAFDSDPLKFRNFLVDFLNHPELASGVMVKDPISARPIDLKAFAGETFEIVQQLERWAEEGKKIGLLEINELKSMGNGLFGKKSALNLNGKFGTLELRGLRSQKNALTLRDVMRLLQARINLTNENMPEIAPKLKMTKKEKSLAFKEYVEGGDLNYEDYKHLAARRYQLNCPSNFARMRGH